MKVKFIPQDVEFEIAPGQSVMHVAQDHGLYIKSVCKGVPSCAECRVRIVEGEHNVLSPGSEELALIGTGHFIDRRRLSCQLKCFGDITVDMTEQIQKQQGLIGGKKAKRAMAKDDRVEQAVAIRSEDDMKPDMSGDPTAETDMNAQAKPRSQHPGARGERGPRPQGSGERGPRPSIGGGGNRGANPGNVGGGPVVHAAGSAPASAASGPGVPPGSAPGPEGGPRKRRRRRGGRGGGSGGGGPGGGGGAGGGPGGSRPPQ